MKMQNKGLLEDNENEDRNKLPFQDLFSSIKEEISILSENKRMGADLLFMTTYMASITTAQATRPEIFAYSAARTEYAPSKYFAKVEFFVKRWNFSYSRALEVIAAKVRNEMLRSMLNRYANSIMSGVPDEDFISRELITIRSIYRNDYEQGLEMLKKWGDAYISMLFSAAVIGIILMISVAIYSPGSAEQTLNSSHFIILAISCFGLITMYRAVPSDQKTHPLIKKSKEEEIILRMAPKVIPIALIAGLLLFYLSSNFGLALLITGLVIIPLGIIGYLDDRNIVLRDSEFTVFIRSLGAIMSGKGLTITSALQEIDRKSLPNLKSLINGVYSKLNLGLDEKQVWNRFVGESGSDLIYKYLIIFRDSVDLGGSSKEIGQVIGASMLEQVLLRDKRNTISMGFMVLLIPMHTMMVGIFLFLYHILLTMSEKIESVSSQMGNPSESLSSVGSISGGNIGGDGLGLFMNFPKETMNTYIIITILLILISNILAGKIVMGGDRYIIFFIASLLMIVTGIVFIVAPIIVSTFFNIAAFETVGV